MNRAACCGSAVEALYHERIYHGDHMKWHVKLACPHPTKPLYLHGHIIFNCLHKLFFLVTEHTGILLNITEIKLISKSFNKLVQFLSRPFPSMVFGLVLPFGSQMSR